VACCLLSYYVVSEYIVTTVVVQGRSMAPTLTDGDRYLLHRWQLLFREPARGDLVVIRDAVRNDFVVKRIVGLPRERIQFKDGEVFVNGRKLVENYLTHGTATYVLGGVRALVSCRGGPLLRDGGQSGGERRQPDLRCGQGKPNPRLHPAIGLSQR
jgi:signal peptidase I